MLGAELVVLVLHLILTLLLVPIPTKHLTLSLSVTLTLGQNLLLNHPNIQTLDPRTYMFLLQYYYKGVFKFKPAAGAATANLRATLIAYRLNRFLQK